MAAQSRFAKARWTNPAYRPSGVFRPSRTLRRGDSQASGVRFFFFWGRAPAFAESPLSLYQSIDGEAEEIGRLGITRAGDPMARRGARPRKVRLCDREGCSEIGDRPAPKAPQQQGALVFLRSPRGRIQQELELFCRPQPRGSRAPRGRGERGNRLPPIGAMEMGRARRRQPKPRRDARARRARARSDADFKAIKAAHRRLVKETHPDANPGDKDAAKRFKQIQAAYDVLRRPRSGRVQTGLGRGGVALARFASPARSCWARPGCGSR